MIANLDGGQQASLIAEGDMRSWIKVLAVLLICLVVLGLYRGWFSVSSSHSEPEGDKVNIDLSVDKGKMKSDIKRVERKVGKEVKEVEGELKTKETAK